MAFFDDRPPAATPTNSVPIPGTAAYETFLDSVLYEMEDARLKTRDFSEDGEKAYALLTALTTVFPETRPYMEAAHFLAWDELRELEGPAFTAGYQAALDMTLDGTRHPGCLPETIERRIRWRWTNKGMQPVDCTGIPGYADDRTELLQEAFHAYLEASAREGEGTVRQLEAILDTVATVWPGTAPVVEELEPLIVGWMNWAMDRAYDQGFLAAVEALMANGGPGHHGGSGQAA